MQCSRVCLLAEAAHIQYIRPALTSGSQEGEAARFEQRILYILYQEVAFLSTLQRQTSLRSVSARLLTAALLGAYEV